MKYIFLLLVPLPVISMQQMTRIFKQKNTLSNGDILITFSSDSTRAYATKEEHFFKDFYGIELEGKYEIEVVSPKDLFLSLKYQYKEQKKKSSQIKNKLQ